jgi:hypothetical protein
VLWGWQQLLGEVLWLVLEGILLLLLLLEWQLLGQLL